MSSMLLVLPLLGRRGLLSRLSLLPNLDSSKELQERASRGSGSDSSMNPASDGSGVRLGGVGLGGGVGCCGVGWGWGGVGLGGGVRMVGVGVGVG